MPVNPECEVASSPDLIVCRKRERLCAVEPNGLKLALRTGGLILSLFLAVCCASAAENEAPKLRPPAVPLVACDPYFSVWSPADNLNDSDTVHWTGKPHRLTSLVRIDDRVYRLMGAHPSAVPALPQTNLEVLPTRTIYSFAGAGVE